MAPYSVRFHGAERILIVDSGSGGSVLQPGVADVTLESTTLEPFGVMGYNLDIRGEQLQHRKEQRQR
jgi:hypothetical protein